MRTTSGLNTPRIGEGGPPGALTTRHQARRDPGARRRHVEAAKVREGDRLLGGRTGTVYTALHVDDTGAIITITVQAPSGDIRRWTRDRRFPIERA